MLGVRGKASGRIWEWGAVTVYLRLELATYEQSLYVESGWHASALRVSWDLGVEGWGEGREEIFRVWLGSRQENRVLILFRQARVYIWSRRNNKAS